MNIVIKPLEEQYVDQVCRLEETAFSMPWQKSAFLEMIEEKNACYLVALEGKKVVAACGLRNILGEGEITNVVTDENYRNQGIGYFLLSHLMERGKEMGVEAFTLEVRVSNYGAIHLYEKLGFRKEGIRKNFYEKPREDGLIMWKR